MNAPEFNIDLNDFWINPYPALATMRRTAPICFVPQLDATLLTCRDDIFVCEKNVAVFSSEQPDGLMTQLMGQNMMRKDGQQHIKERREILPAVSPRTIKEVWKQYFIDDTRQLLAELSKKKTFDIVSEFAMPVSGNALRHITGLTKMTAEQMDAVSQAMIDGIANYAGRRDITQRCHEATAFIDQCIADTLPTLRKDSDPSLLNVLLSSKQSLDSVKANIKLAISGGQNEPRDAISGTVWALLTHPEELQRVKQGEASWLQAFEEYARWNSPIGMSPRRIATDHQYKDIEFTKETKTFLMFSSGNRDELIFDNPDTFDISRDTSKAISFGAGPHFCAGAAASRTLISEVALPMLFEQFPNMQLRDDVEMRGWAFRGALSLRILTN